MRPAESPKEYSPRPYKLVECSSAEICETTALYVPFCQRAPIQFADLLFVRWQPIRPQKPIGAPASLLIEQATHHEAPDCVPELPCKAKSRISSVGIRNVPALAAVHTRFLEMRMVFKQVEIVAKDTSTSYSSYMKYAISSNCIHGLQASSSLMPYSGQYSRSSHNCATLTCSIAGVIFLGRPCATNFGLTTAPNLSRLAFILRICDVEHPTALAMVSGLETDVFRAISACTLWVRLSAFGIVRLSYMEAYWWRIVKMPN